MKKACYADPVVQPVLQNRLGVDLHGAAKSIGVRFNDLKKKFENTFLGPDGFSHPDFRYKQITTINPTNREGVTSYILDINTAKFLLARYQTNLGNDYLAYLILFESDKKNKIVDSLEVKYSNDPVMQLINESYTQARNYRIALLELEQKSNIPTSDYCLQINKPTLLSTGKNKILGKPYSIREYVKQNNIKNVDVDEHRWVAKRAIKISRKKDIEIVQDTGWRKTYRFDQKVIKAAIKEHLTLAGTP